MQVGLDSYDRATAYADLREGESLTADLRARAIARAGQLGAEHVEFWRPPYGRGADRMEGFVELARVPPTSNAESDGREPVPNLESPIINAPTCESVEQV
jgi:hypothetical protein